MSLEGTVIDGKVVFDVPISLPDGTRVQVAVSELTTELAAEHDSEMSLTDDDLDAIQEAIDDMENGDVGVPFDEFDRKFRARHNLPPKS